MTAIVAACSPAAQVAPQASKASTIPATSVPTLIATAVPSEDATPVPTPSMTDIVAAGATLIPQDAGPDWITAAGGAAWVATGQGVLRYDAVTGEQKAVAPVTGVCLGMDAGFGSLWVGDCDARVLVRVDLTTAGIQARIPLPVPALQDEGSIAAGEGAVWIVSSDASLVKVDPASGKVVGQFALSSGAAAARAGLGSVWVTNSSLNALLRVDPKTGKVVSTIDVGAYPRFLAIGENAVWVMDQRDGAVTRVDRDGKSVATIRVSRSPIEGGDIAFGGGYVWVRTEAELLIKIDPATNAVAATYGPPSGSGGVAADGTAAWLSAHDVSSIWRLPLP